MVTASSAGYTSQDATTNATTPVMLGHVTEDKPTVTGRAVVGRTLTAHVKTFAPTTATPQYLWYRSGHPIRGARAATYVLTPADVGNRVYVLVTYQATNWISHPRRSVAVRGIRAVPVLHARTTMRHGHVYLQLRVRAPGLSAPGGRARVLLGGHGLGRFRVIAGHGGTLLATLPSGTHQLTVVYHGYGRQTSARTVVPVTVP